MAEVDRAEPIPTVDTVAPIAVPLAVVGVYVGNGISVWVTVGAILGIGLFGIGYVWKHDIRKATLMLLCLVIFTPSVANLHAVVPILGSVLLGIYAWRGNPRRRSHGAILQILPIGCTVVVTLGVIGFQATDSSGTGAFEWRTLPGLEYGVSTLFAVVLIASTVNACFEELLWRVHLAELFRREKPFVFQWAFLSICFGVSHLFGTPGGMVGVGFATLFGFAMCVIRSVSNGSIVWVLVAHLLADVILLGGVYGLFAS